MKDDYNHRFANSQLIRDKKFKELLEEIKKEFKTDKELHLTPDLWPS